MKIGFIGAGKVGSAFGHYLKDKGIDVLGYYSKSKDSAILAAKFTDTYYFELEELVKSCDYIFITTPDDVISAVWNKLKSFNLQDKKIFHMSGSLSSFIFDGIENYGAYGYSFHPLFPFTDKSAYKGLDNAIFTIEGKRIASIQGFLAVSKINYVEIRGEDKAKYHAAAVFASNYIVCLSKISKELLLECGIPEKEIEKFIYPLMLQAIDNIRDNGVENALTGPIVRGDIGTIMNHREVLGGFKNIYDELGEVALGISNQNGKLAQSKVEEINIILGGKANEKNSRDL